MNPEKIAPDLLVALEDFQDQGRAGLLPHRHTLGLETVEPGPRPARIVVFLRCREQADLTGLAQLGVALNQDRGRVRTAFMPVESVGPVSDAPAVDRITPARRLRLLMDTAPARVHVPQFRARTGLDGAGVIVGVVDSGIDPAHTSFAGRIERIWDQTLSGSGVPEGGYGRELQGAALGQSSDVNGHGTHVAGIAAGDHAVFGGVAPRAALVVVKTDLQDAHIADGIRYIFRVAADSGRPAAVNLSLGGHFDAHDGSDDLSTLIDDESGPGRIVCCAAGNEGDDDIHARRQIPAGATRTVSFRVPAGTTGTALLNGWYPAINTLSISLRSPAGNATPFQAIVSPPANPTTVHLLPEARVLTVTGGPDPSNGDHQFLVQVQGPAAGTAVAGGAWQLRLRNTSATPAPVDIWMLDDQPAPVVRFTGVAVNDAVKIGSPGASAGAVTVASFTTKVTWTDSGGNARSVSSTLDAISSFSSEGPLRTGARKPDLAAPGEMIVSARSAASTPRPERIIDSGHVIMRGTSMATPFMTGLVALLLQRQPALTPAQAKALLRAHCAIPNRPAGSFDRKWGYGLIDALNL